ncbi:MAG: hypothetical protein KDD34_08405, partial [Bdellovibrionales bacterium]|nr:hypothetical protein [Bdellovibrionales bacterium]
FDKNGMTLSGVCKERDLIEIIEIKEHPWYIGVQFHPEFKSRPLSPHPLFTSFVEASLKQHMQQTTHKKKMSSKIKRTGYKKEVSKSLNS